MFSLGFFFLHYARWLFLINSMSWLLNVKNVNYIYIYYYNIHNMKFSNILSYCSNYFFTLFVCHSEVNISVKIIQCHVWFIIYTLNDQETERYSKYLGFADLPLSSPLHVMLLWLKSTLLLDVSSHPIFFNPLSLCSSLSHADTSKSEVLNSDFLFCSPWWGILDSRGLN